jgi:hypothetical protein
VNTPPRFWARAIARAVALGLVAVAACRDSAAPTEQTAATFTGRWAGQPFTGEASAFVARGGAAGDTLYVLGSHRVGQYDTDQYVRVRALVSAPGTYALGGDAAEVVDLVGGDGITSIYAGSRPGAGTLFIATYAGPGGVVEGTLSFEAQPDRTSPRYGSVARFEDGWFRATIQRSR